MNNLSNFDLVAIGGYFLLTLLVAWWAARGRREQSTDYFLAGRNNGWFVVGASMFASNIGSEHLVGLAGTGAKSGMAVGHFEWLSSLIALILGWLFVPFYLRSGVVTMPEFLERRYNRPCRWYLTLLSVVAYVLTKISVGLYAGGIVIGAVTGFDPLFSAGLVVIFTGAYTVVGGLRAVLYTDTLQAIIFSIGSVILVWCGLEAVGGWSALREMAPTDHFDPAGHFSMWKSVNHPDFPWTGIVFGAPILGIWYWCTDQYIVQRVLSARNQNEAQTAAVFTGYLKILPVFMFLLPGILFAALYPQLLAAHPDKLGEFQADQALPNLLLYLPLPVGVRGIMLAALLAALMSSLSSTFNSCSTLVTWDLYRHFHPEASERTLIRVGRATTVVMVVLGLLWIPFMKYISSQLYVYLQSVSGYLAPPIAACFLLGLFIPRLNGIGALTAMLTGFVLGAARLVLELVNNRDSNLLAGFPAVQWIASINFLHFAALLFVFCSALLVIVSFMTRPPGTEQLEGLTWWTRGSRTGAADFQTHDLDEHSAFRRKLNIALSVILVVVIGILWTVFA